METHGYKHTEATCPGCGGNYGMIEEISPGVYRYTCWCGMYCKVTDD